MNLSPFRRVVAQVFFIGLFVTGAHAEDVRVGGTGSAMGLLALLAPAYTATQPQDRVILVPGLGSGGALTALSDGMLSLAVAGRALNAAETAKGLVGRPLLRSPFVFVSSSRTPQTLTLADVIAVYAGRKPSWPDGTNIRPILRPKSDAASIFLVDAVPGMAEAMERLRSRPDVPIAATDQDNAMMAEQTPNSLAGMTLVQFLTEKPRLQIVTFGGGGDPASASDYPLSQEMFVATSASAPPAVQRFLDFVHSPAGTALLRAHGAVPSAAPAVQR